MPVSTCWVLPAGRDADRGRLLTGKASSQISCVVEGMKNQAGHDCGSGLKSRECRLHLGVWRSSPCRLAARRQRGNALTDQTASRHWLLNVRIEPPMSQLTLQEAAAHWPCLTARWRMTARWRTELACTHLLSSLQPLLCPHQVVALGRHVGTLFCRPQESGFSVSEDMTLSTRCPATPRAAEPASHQAIEVLCPGRHSAVPTCWQVLLLCHLLAGIAGPAATAPLGNHCGASTQHSRSALRGNIAPLSCTVWLSPTLM